MHSTRGRLDVDLSLVDLQTKLGAMFLRVHRAWLANLALVRELTYGKSGAFLSVGGFDAKRGIRVPVAREQAPRVRVHLLAGTVGCRAPRGTTARSDAAILGDGATTTAASVS